MKVQCEPYANGRGWWHVPGCPHVDWQGDEAFFGPHLRTWKVVTGDQHPPFPA
jgi:hypothetical protein